MTTTTSDSTQKSYFDIHTKGTGYIQRVREVPVKGAKPYLACTIAALIGPAKATVLRYFDVRVAGGEAKKLVRNYLGVDERKCRPLVRFRLGDPWVSPFIRSSGERQGEAAASVKSRLLQVELLDYPELEQIEQHELITWGIGYLSQPKDAMKDGAPHLSCSIAALTGPVDIPLGQQREYRYFHTVVTGEQAQTLVRRYTQAVNANRKVLIAFKLNDMWADPYIRTSGEKIGQAAATLESELTHINLVKVDGEQVYPESNASATEGATALEETTATDEDNGDLQPTAPVDAPAQVA
ncbi:TPA: DUF3577 domain-containing protein [Pseudomonas aeruginosa]|uniref:DUF3577 domain-containing protein n=1 Tax=Pseudomonas aeruginosa TaxID=287 RepID=UPI003727ECFB